MARPSRNLDPFNDIVVRDVAHRHQFQTAPSANIIQHLYSHVSGTTANVSAAEVVSVDGSQQGQWDLLLSTSARRLNANTITTNNTAAWSANSIISVRQASTTIRSANVIVGNLIATAYTATRLTLAGLLNEASTYQWTSRTSAADSTWRGITYGNGLFVAVSSFSGTGNNVMTSPDGITWTLRGSVVDNGWVNVTYGKGLFVAVALAGTGNRVMTSPDGITWTLRGSAAGNQWWGVTYGNGLFVAVSDNGSGNRVMTSPDGITWTSRTSAADNAWWSVVYAAGLFVAVARSGTGNGVMTSPDGITWTSRTSAADNQWNGVTYGNGLFVAVSDNGSGNRVMTSPDGITWTSRTSAADIAWSSVKYAAGLFVAVSYGGTGVMTSPDGITWTLRANSHTLAWTHLTYGNGLFVAVAESGTGNRVMTWKWPTPSLDVTGDAQVTGSISANSLAVDGGLDVGYMKRTEFIVTGLSGSVLDVDVCEISHLEGGSYLMEMTLVQSKENNQTAKYYKFPITNNATMGEWKFLLPMVDEGLGPNDYLMQIKVAGTIATLRLLTTTAGTGKSVSDITVSLTTHTSPYGVGNDIVITRLNIPSTNVNTNVDIYSGTMLTVSKNVVGINAFMSENPAANPNNNKLFVGGNARISDTLTLGSLNVTNGVNASTLTVTSTATVGNLATTGTLGGTLTTAAQPNITQVGTLDSLNVTNGVNASTLTLSSDITLASGLADVRNLKVSTASILDGTVSGSGVTSSVASGSSALVTSGGVYSALNLVSGGALGKLDAFDSLSVGEPDKSGTFRVVGDTSLGTSTGAFRSVVSASDQSWSSVCYGNGRYVAVSEGTATSNVMTSTDGRMWVSQTAPFSTGAGWKSVAFGNGWYVAIALNGSIMKSANGSTWTVARTDTVNGWTSIAFGNNVFVAVSLGTNVLVGDATATTWTLNTNNTLINWQSIAFGATQFVAVASSGTGLRVATSSNGTAWTSRTSAADLDWKTVSYGGGAFVALADAGTGRIMTSEDEGLTWSLRTNPVALAWTGVAYGAGRWLGVASNGAMTSLDGGVTWSSRAVAATLTWRAIVYGDSEFVAVATSGTANRAMVWPADNVTTALAVNGSTSQLTIAAPNLSVVADSTVVQGNVTVQRIASTSNAMTWTTRTSPTTNTWQAVTYGNDLFVAVSTSGVGNRIATSEDGVQWTSRKSPGDNNWFGVAYGNLTYVAVSTTGSDCVMTSSNAKDWTLRSSADDNLLWRGVAYGVVNGVGRFVGVSQSSSVSNIMYSDNNGVTWTLVNTGISVGWFRIAFGNGVFVVTSNATQFATSPDGINWTTRTPPISTPRGITFGGGLFVIVCSTAATNKLFTSRDGVTWTGYVLENNVWASVTYGDGLFVAVASTGTNRVVTSNDGITWTARLASAALSWSAVAYGKGVFAALANDTTAGLYDRIMTSPGVSDTITTSPLLVVDTVTGNVGIRTASPAFALDVAGTTRSNTISTGTISTWPANGLFFELGQILDSTVLIQGPTLGWNSESGAGRTDIVNKSGTGGGGISFWNSGGSGSAFSNGKSMLAQMTPLMTLVPNDLYCANSVGTNSTTSGYRFFYRQLPQPCVWTTSFTVTSQAQTSFFLSVALTDAPFCLHPHSTMVHACNGDPAANSEFFIYSAFLFVAPAFTTTLSNSQPTNVRLWCRGANGSGARVNLQITFYPV